MEDNFTGNDLVIESETFTKAVLVFGPNVVESAYTKEHFAKTPLYADDEFNLKIRPNQFVMKLSNPGTTVYIELTDEDMLRLLTHYVNVKAELKEFGVIFPGEENNESDS